MKQLAALALEIRVCICMYIEQFRPLRAHTHTRTLIKKHQIIMSNMWLCAVWNVMYMCKQAGRHHFCMKFNPAWETVIKLNCGKGAPLCWLLRLKFIRLLKPWRATPWNIYHFSSEKMVTMRSTLGLKICFFPFTYEPNTDGGITVAMPVPFVNALSVKSEAYFLLSSHT